MSSTLLPTPLNHVDSSLNLSRPGLLSLCSGTGMLDIAIELAWEHVFGVRPRVVGFAEREAYAASLLMARMEEQSLEQAPVFCGDFRDLDARPMRGWVDIFAAGLPCQPYSTAGKQKGLKDSRSWGVGDGPLPHALRIIEEAEPAVVCLENVPQWVTGGAFRKFGEALCAMGFEIEDPLFIRASDVGASHRRERVFIMAHRKGERSEQLLSAGQRLERLRKAYAERPQQGMADTAQQYWAQHGCSAPQSGRPGTGMAHAGGAGLPRREQCGECGECGEERQSDHAQSTPELRGPLLADTGGEGQPWRCEFIGEPEEAQLAAMGYPVAELHRSLLDGLFAPGPDSGDWARLLCDEPWKAPALEPGIRLLVDGLALSLDAFRADQLRCGGNGVVVGQAAASFVHLFKRLISR